ncbi:LRR containing protein [Entamoeba marina]
MELEYVYLMNVVLYLDSKKDVVNFITINSKCKEAVDHMFINPPLHSTSLKTIRKLFPNLQTLQCHDASTLDKHFLNGIVYIDITNNTSVLRPNSKLLQFSQLLRSIHTLCIGNHSQDVPSDWDVLQVLRIEFEKGSRNLNNIFMLKNLVSLRKLIITSFVEQPIDQLRLLGETFHNVKICLIFTNNDSFSKQYVDQVVSIKNIEVYFNVITSNVLNKNILPVGNVIFIVDNCQNNIEDFMKIVNTKNPTSIEIKTMDESIDDNTSNAKKCEFDFSTQQFLSELCLTIPINKTFEIEFPSNLTTLTIDYMDQSTCDLSQIKTLPISDFNCYNAKDVKITLPETIQHLNLDGCENSFFFVVGLPSLKYVECYSDNCIIPFTTTITSLHSTHNNKFNLYGNGNEFFDVINMNNFETVSFGRWVGIYTNVDLYTNTQHHIDKIDCSPLSMCNITLVFGSVDHIILGHKNHVTAIGNVKTISFDEIESLQVLESRNESEIPIPPSCKSVTYSEIQQNTLDLSKLQLTQISFNRVAVKTLILPTTLQEISINKLDVENLLNIENTQLNAKTKFDVSGRYNHGVYPNIKIVEYIRNIQCKNVKIMNCDNLNQIYFPVGFEKLHIDNCNKLELINLLDVTLDTISVRNCASLAEIKSKSVKRTIIENCPSIK